MWGKGFFGAGWRRMVAAVRLALPCVDCNNCISCYVRHGNVTLTFGFGNRDSPCDFLTSMAIFEYHTSKGKAKGKERGCGYSSVVECLSSMHDAESSVLHKLNKAVHA